MKKIVVLLAAFITGTAFAQNVGIGTDMPASKLTINGTDPDIGIMNNGLAHGFIKASGVNLNIGTASDNPTGKLILGTKDNNHFNIDHLGRVSIGTNSSFNADLKLNGSSPIFGFLHEEVQKGFIRLSGDHFKLGTYPGNSGKIVFAPKNVDKIWIDEEGQIGIGTSIPVSQLTISSTNATIQLQSGINNKGFLQTVSNNLNIGTNSTNTTGHLILQTKQVDRMTIDENGQVGIGTTSPSSILTINGTDPIVQLRNDDVDKGFVQLVGDNLRVGTNISNSFGSCILRTKGQDRLYVNYDGQMGLNMIPDQTTSTFAIAEDDNNNSGIALYHGGTRRAMFNYNGTNPFLTAQTGYFYIYRNSSYPFILHPDGNFTIGGHNTASGYRVSIYGKAIATEFTALPYGSWPDYVFEKNYNLRSLDEVKKFIEKNKHLPGIPPAAEMEKKGIPLGDISKRLMEKVEELTLYILQQQEQIDELKKLVQSQKKND